MPRKTLLIIVAVLIALTLSGCGDPHTVIHTAHTHGFWRGLWDGMTVLFAFFGNLFGIGHWNIYSVDNNGGWYNFGFLLGIGAFSTSASRSAHITLQAR